MYSLLDNPIWHALSSEQLQFSEGDTLARRFLPSIGPLAGMLEQSGSAYASLKRLCKPDEQLVLFLPEPPSLPPDWCLDVGGMLTQMVCERAFDDGLEPENQEVPHHSRQISPLTGQDVPDMLALTHLTKPGPFREHTHELGLYLGIRHEGQLAAMAGERLKPAGCSEVSAVCTHPQFQGKGYAQALISSVCHRIQARNRVPFLHTRPDNVRAIGVYEKLGFRTRRMLYLAVVRHSVQEN